MIQRVQIFTVDPLTRGFEFILKDGSMVSAQVWEVPAFFRWPKQGEFWTVERNGNHWKLGDRMENVNADFPIESLAEGEAKLSGSILYTEEGLRLATVPTVVAALPTDAVDSQEVYFQTMGMVATGTPPWHLRHRLTNPDGTPNANAFKWETVASAVEIELTTGSTTTSSTSPVLVGGPSITLPLAGDYDVTLMARSYNTNNAGGVADIILCKNGTPTGVTLDPFQGSAGATITLFAGNLARTTRLLNLATADVLDLRMQVNGASMTADYRTLRVRPVRVG